MREVADVRTHGTTAETPIARFERDERRALTPLAAKAPFLQVRELSRRVHTDACIELDTNRYSVPWRLIGESVTVVGPSAKFGCCTQARKWPAMCRTRDGAPAASSAAIWRASSAASGWE
ncbi:MAG: hypothetical protein U1E77_09935 [Inhella sp.]